MEASDETKNQIDKVIGDLSVRYGHDSSLLDRLRPVVERVFAARVEADTREELIALVEETYATHSRLRQSMAAETGELIVLRYGAGSFPLGCL